MAMQELIECKNISKTYGKKTALKKVSFSLPLHGIFALIGRNGAGKTTLIKILSTLLEPTSGTAEIGKINIVKNPTEIRKDIAVLSQEAKAVNWLTPRQQIFIYLLYRGMGINEAKIKTDEVIRIFKIGKNADIVNSRLSGGIKRKVLIAMVISTGSKILFLDEPTIGLDPIAREELWSILRRLKKNHFIFLTTHYLNEAEALADTIGIFDEGRLVHIGTLQELRKNINYQYSLYVQESGINLKSLKKYGKVVKGVDKRLQLLVDQKNADFLSKRFIQQKIRFSINPISLDDIFYYFTKKQILEENYG